MDLEKVIFVDAGSLPALHPPARLAPPASSPGSLHPSLFSTDQIVRTDLKDLVDEDLFGAPYGYAPMGDDREEMEGFRFWKTGQSAARRERCAR